MRYSLMLALMILPDVAFAATPEPDAPACYTQRTRPDNVVLPKARAGLRMGHGQVLDHMFCDGLQDVREGLLMGAFAEESDRDYQFTRAAQDDFAIESLARANAAIGRAMTLILQNIGGAIPGETDMATLGQPAKYTCCFAENVAESPWAPLHVERGFAADASVVTAVGISGTGEVNDSDSQDAAGLAQTFAQSMLIAGISGGAGLLGGGEPLCLFPPEWAAMFDCDGYTKQQAKAAIWQQATLPIEKLPPGLRKHRMAAASDPSANVIRVAEKADDLMIVVAGGVGRKAAYLPTWGGTTKAISREIKIRK